MRDRKEFLYSIKAFTSTKLILINTNYGGLGACLRNTSATQGVQLTVDYSTRFGVLKGTRIENFRLLRSIFTILNSLRSERQIRLIAFDRAHR